MDALRLHHREYGAATAPAVLLLHGLLGSSVNWQRVAQGLAEDFRIIVPDLRNHGRSPHSAAMDFPSMAADVRALLERLAIDKAVLVGHSMGGKVAMHLALTAPQHLRALVSVDMAPVSYSNRLGRVVGALRELPLGGIGRRSEADRWLASRIADSGVRAYLLQNLVRDGESWRWRCNLEALDTAMPHLLSFELPDHARPYAGPALFIGGDRSEYVTADQEGAIRHWFPAAERRVIANAGHWVYAEQPEAFLEVLGGWLKRLLP